MHARRFNQDDHMRRRQRSLMSPTQQQLLITVAILIQQRGETFPSGQKTNDAKGIITIKTYARVCVGVYRSFASAVAIQRNPSKRNQFYS